MRAYEGSILSELTGTFRFQEQRIPCRSIVFINSKMYWHCLTTEWSEDIRRDEDPDLTWLPKAKEYETVAWSLPDCSLWEDISQYSLRRLGHDSDTLNAFAGIFKHHGQIFDKTVFQGLCLNDFERSLLFTLDSAKHGDLTTLRRRQFPSYSWAGWRNMILYDLSRRVFHELDQRHTYISWYKISPDGCEELLQTSRTGYDSNFVPYPRFQSSLHMLVPAQVGRTQQADAIFAARARGYPVLNFQALILKLSLDADGLIYEPWNDISVGVGYLPGDLRPVHNSEPFSWVILATSTSSDCASLLANKLSGVAAEEAIKIGMLLAMAIVLVDGAWEKAGIGLILQRVLHTAGSGPAWGEIILA